MREIKYIILIIGLLVLNIPSQGSNFHQSKSLHYTHLLDLTQKSPIPNHVSINLSFNFFSGDICDNWEDEEKKNKGCSNCFLKTENPRYYVFEILFSDKGIEILKPYYRYISDVSPPVI